MNNVIDFKKARGLPIENSPDKQIAFRTSASVTELVQPVKFKIHTERLRPQLDIGAEIFFKKLIQSGKVTILNYSPGIEFTSILSVDDAAGEAFTFPVDNFLRLTVMKPSDVTPENIDGFLLESLNYLGIQIGMQQAEADEEGFEEQSIDSNTMHDFFPESIPVLRDPNHPDDFVYSCFFSESTHFVTSVTAEYFLKPHEVTVLELMCLARRDFIDEGNSLKNQGHMELEFTQRSDIRITRIPLDLLDNILSEAISRKSPLTMNFDPETRIQKYCDSQVFPRVNPMLYDEFDDDFE